MEYPKQILLFSSPILSSVCDTHQTKLMMQAA